MQSLKGPVARVLPAAWITILILPSLAWILIDERVWPWDPGYYGDWTLRAADLLARGMLHEWYDFNMHALQLMPPLIVWLGQFFVPLRHVTGDVESALMLLNICTGAATLALIYRLARNLGAGLLASLAATTVCGGADLFIGLMHHYFTEPLQSFAAALSMLVALHVERRSGLRNLALVLLLIDVAFLAKASSLTFIAPALAYMAVALFATRGDARARATRIDKVLLAVGVVGLILTFIWYNTNWTVMAKHFVQATTGEEVQNYYPTTLSFAVKPKYWIGTLADAVFLSRWGLAALCLMIVAAIAVAMAKLRARFSAGFATLLRESVTTGALYGLYLAGMVIAIIFSFALQINEDPRYLAAVVPLIAGLVAWTLTVLRRPVLSALVILTGIANAVMANAIALHFFPSLYYIWLWPVDKSLTERTALTRIIDATCQDGTQINAIGVSYPWTNSNTANFFAQKQRLDTHFSCTYFSMPQDDVKTAFTWLDTTRIAYAVTVAPEQQDPPNFVNVSAKPIAEALAADARFELMPSSSHRFKIYRRLPEPSSAPESDESHTNEGRP